MLWLFLLLVVVLLCVWLLRPLPIQGICSHPHPVDSYADAVQQVVALQTEDQAAGVRVEGLTKFYDHGSQTDWVIVLLHGYTNCPEQFAQFGQKLHGLGYNVLIPRMPYHGLADRMTKDFAHMTAEDLAALGDRAVDIAAGLGKRIAVMGISGGGTLTLWLTQNRKEVSVAFPLGAFQGVSFIPPVLTKPFAHLCLALPVFFVWWDPRYKEKTPYSVDYAYPRYTLRGFGEMLRMASATKQAAARQAPAAGAITFLINDAEPAVSTPEIMQIRAAWQARGAQVDDYHFEKSLKLPHDLITPGTPGVPTDEIEARLEALIQQKFSSLSPERANDVHV